MALNIDETVDKCISGSAGRHDKETVSAESGFILPHCHSCGGHSHRSYNAQAMELHNELGNTEHFEQAAGIFRHLSDPNRLRIFWLLNHREECVVNIAALMDMSSPAVSHHLKTLVESGFLVNRRDGKEVYYRAADNEQNRMLHEIAERIMTITCPEKRIDLQADQEEVVRNIHRYLTEHLNERITIEELGKRFLINTTTLKQAFKRVYGTTIAAHMRMHRMEQAALLLKTTEEDISVIARAVGYDSAARFATAFRETYGAAPSEYRQGGRRRV